MKTLLAIELLIVPLIATPIKTYEPLVAVPVVQEEIVETPVDTNDLDILAHVITGEAGSDYYPEELKYYVGSVVLNRVSSPYYPDTIESVVFQPGQYQCTWDGNYYREPSERIYQIAEELLTFGSQLPENVVFQAEFYQGDGVYCQVGNTYFCYLN